MCVEAFEPEVVLFADTQVITPHINESLPYHVQLWKPELRLGEHSEWKFPAVVCELLGKVRLFFICRFNEAFHLSNNRHNLIIAIFEYFLLPRL